MEIMRNEKKVRDIQANMKYDVAQKYDLRGKRMSNFELYKGAFFDHFDGIEDTRQEGKVLHKLIDVIFIVFSGVICGFDEWDDIHFWGHLWSDTGYFCLLASDGIWPVESSRQRCSLHLLQLPG